MEKGSINHPHGRTAVYTAGALWRLVGVFLSMPDRSHVSSWALLKAWMWWTRPWPTPAFWKMPCESPWPFGKRL